MTLKTFLQGYSFQRLVLFVWLVSSALVMFSQKSIDAIVNGTMYGYGLQFSTNWAQPYWTYESILYVSQFVAIALSVAALALGFLKKDNDAEGSPEIEKKCGDPALKLEPDEVKPASNPEQNAYASGSGRRKKGGCTTGISCPNCKRTLNKALVMLDFGDGKATLVNVCPYCNTVLGNVEEHNENLIVKDQDQDKEVVL